MAKVIRVIKPKKLNERELMKFADIAVHQVIDEAEKLFLRSVEHFTHPVVFKVKYNRTTRKVTGRVSTGDEIYKFLTRGTAVRYVVMSRDFISKTRPGVIPSRAGRGGVGRVAADPMPGIEARDYDKLVRAEVEPKFFEYGMRAMREAVRKSGHARR